MEEELFGLTWDDEIDEVDEEEKKKKKDKELERNRPFFPWYCGELLNGVDAPQFNHQLKYKEDRELYEAYLEKALPALEQFPLQTQNKKMLRANCRGRGILDTGPKEALRMRVEAHIRGELEPFRVVRKREKLKVEPQKNRLGAALDQLPHGLLQLVLGKCETEDLLVLMRVSKYLHLDAKQVVSARAVAFFGREEATPMALDMYGKVSLMVSVQRYEFELWLGLHYRSYPEPDDYFRDLVIRCLDDYGSIESTSSYVKEHRLFHAALAKERQEVEQGMDQRVQEVRKAFLQLGLPHDYVAYINNHYRFGKIIEVFLRYKKFFRFLIPDCVNRVVRNFVAGQDGQGLERVTKMSKLRQLSLIWGVLEDIEAEMKLAQFVRHPTVKLLKYCFRYNDGIISFPDGTRLDTEMFRAKLRIYLETIVLAQSNNVFVFHTNPEVDNCRSFPHDQCLDSKEAVAREMNISENLLVRLDPMNEQGMKFFAIFDN
jgi:hypothetical protein